MIAVLLVLMNTYFLTASRDMIFRSKQRFVQSQAAIIETSLADFDRLTVDSVSQVMQRLDVTGVTHITIIGGGGNALYDTADDAAYAPESFITENLSRSLGGYDVFYSRFSDGAFSSSAFTPIMRGGAVTGAVYVHESDSDQGAILLGLQSTLKNISIVIVTLSILLITFILWTIMRRITSILRAIESVREGEYNYHIKMNGNDELAMLGDEFNSLTGRLRETDDIRRRFVADASHELKTPLASIRLLSDSILQNEEIDVSTIREFVADIGDEAERLTRTTEKLMTLTRLDNDVASPNASVDMRGVVVSTLRMLRPLAASYGLLLDSALDGGCTVFATEDSLHQIIFNLIENAIKYNTPGGSVSVRLTREHASALFTVEDTGIGVPDDDLPYIFDRFYRVDKARSRASGGSGLGLSIVRDTVREYGGSISAARRAAGGMSFQVRFPLYIPAE
ncbi:MAG: HAMP domain-containing histidine kinase [Oscillospiraceae bacterium]|jgi:signal transduction histidine kinase|nr:HAMP domain-containing histidine kinase [Oscillospiraceae bacterium]